MLRLATILITAVFAAGCASETKKELEDSEQKVSTSQHGENVTANIKRLVSSEELILSLTARLRSLNESALNLKLPLALAVELFAKKVSKTDVRKTKREHLADYVTEQSWEIESERTVPLERLDLWQPMLETFEFFENAKFYLIDGQLGNSSSSFKSNVGFAAFGRLKNGNSGFVSGKALVTWNRLNASGEWKISAWTTKSMRCQQNSKPFFSESLKRVLRDPKITGELSTSLHEEITRQLVSGKRVKMQGEYRFHFPQVSLEHPGVSVVDLNEDGLDDFYITRRYRSNLFFANMGDGTFRDISETLGLNFSGGCTSALFFDADNDGDKDLFVGRARNRALLLINENNKFVDRSESNVDFELPYMVSAISSADFNNDGLLDLYLSTYSPIEGSHGRILAGKKIWPSLFLTEEVQTTFAEKSKSTHTYTNMVGPPNILLENLGGGKFAKSSASPSVAGWRKTMHAGWSDFDKDGDPDLYVCNDFGPDDFFRNDKGKFVRVNEEMGVTRLGFGMGVTFGDHNNDGNTDFYVSNMYSKAGVRITREIEQIDQKLVDMASGNYLYNGRSDGFELVSKKDESEATVAKAGWSWGGQFTDANNDGWLDLHVAAGFYSAPNDIAEDVDL